ncbi:MAG: ABC transporter substrate-binding protein [Oscillospiraceae bacterium]|nr:ABC transporter substrate-binding protein [Oscillospiraceae bacterium]
MRTHFGKLRVSAIILAAVFVLLSLSGCGGDPAEQGRYVEDLLNDDVSISGKTASLQAGVLTWTGERDGKQMRFTQSPDEKTARSEPLDLDWLGDLISGGSVSGISTAPDGTVYAMYTDKDGKPGLARSADGQAATVIPMDNWTAMPGRAGNVQGGGPMGARSVNPGGTAQRTPDGGDAPTSAGPGSSQASPAGPGGSYSASVSGPGGTVTNFDPSRSFMPQSVTALDGGFLISYMMQGVYQYDAGGKEVRRYGDTARDMMGGGLSTGGLTVFENTMAWPDTQKGEILIYDLSAGTLTERVAYEDLDSQTYVGLDGTGLFVADGTGVSRWKTGTWELIVDGSLTSLVMPNLTIQDLLCDGGGVWYAFLGGGLMGGESGQLVRFRFDPDIPGQPDKTLTVFSLYDNATARLAVGEFQRKNPGVRVRLEVGIETKSSSNIMIMGPNGAPEETDNSATVEDVIRALNTQLMAGSGPDLIILDGLPLQSYIEKGVLKDITSFVQRLTDEESLLANLTGAYSFEGKTYAVPSRFSLPVMLGDGESLKTLNGLSDLVAAVRNHGANEPALLRAPDQLWQDNGLMMYAYDASVADFTNDDGSLDEAALARYLSDSLALTDALRDVYPEANRRQNVVAFAAAGGGGARRIDAGAMDVANGEALIHIQSLDNSIGYVMIANQLGSLDNMEIASLFQKGYFTPVGGIGITAAGKQQDIAEEFLRTLVGPDVQDNFMADAFPVNRASWGTMIDQLNERFTRAMGQAEFDDMDFPALCETLDTPLFVDQYVKNAVSSHAKDIVNGTLTPEAAAAKIVAGTRIYLAE